MRGLYKHNAPLVLESGEVLPSVEIAYDTFGELNQRRDNVIWVCHALTANSDVADWWPHTVESGKFLDPDR
ncbi:MAG: homoserine O-acetyltransferase, partial [Alistipes sp.]|nr:homoserine O-acetyltransferase [Alistipes sp.]